jgi:hypothetical protein
VSFQCQLVAANGGTAAITEHVVINSGRLTVAAGDLRVTSAIAGKPLGTPVKFRNIPQLPPRVSLILVAGRPIDPGWAQNGID